MWKFVTGKLRGEGGAGRELSFLLDRAVNTGLRDRLVLRVPLWLFICSSDHQVDERGCRESGCHERRLHGL